MHFFCLYIVRVQRKCQNFNISRSQTSVNSSTAMISMNNETTDNRKRIKRRNKNKPALNAQQMTPKQIEALKFQYKHWTKRAITQMKVYLLYNSYTDTDKQQHNKINKNCFFCVC